MTMKNWLLPFVFVLTSTPANANTSGFVTPAELTITFTQLSVIRSDNSQLTLLSGTYPTIFKRSDNDFAAVSLSTITAPEGRFIGVQICYNTDRSVKLSGNEYRGPTTSGVADGDLLYSIGTTATANNSITKTNPSPTSPTTMTGYVVGNGTNNCSSSYFAVPVCVSGDPTHCVAGDNRVDPGTTVPNLNIMLDMFNSVGVDATSMTLDNHIPVYPYPTIGTPGAAIHLTSTTASAIGNISLLFGNDKKLLYSAAYGAGGLAGFCSGNGFVSVTGAPAGAFLNGYGPTAVQSFDGSHKVQFASGNCGTTTTCTSNGIDVLPDVIQPLNGTTALSCVADNNATPPYLGFTYTAGTGDLSGTPTFTIKKIIDPANIFGQCPPASAPCGSY
jgi:hypothetical protein